nr:hypothetical protein [Tanacetum cinerariifolium]
MSKASNDMQERELHQLQLMQENANESCVTSFRLLHSFLQILSYDESKSKRVSERAFMTLFGQDNETFTSTMFLNLDQLQRQLDKDEFQEDKSMATFWVIDNQFQKFIDWQYFIDYDSQMIEKFFAEYTGIKVTQFRETLLQHMGNVKKSVAERAHHQRQYERRVNNRQMQTQESKIDLGSALDVVSSQALDADLVVMESNETKSRMYDTSSSSRNYITHVVDANIRPVNDQVPFPEVQLTAQHNVLANKQQHTDQSEPIYDTYPLEKVDSNTSPSSTNMSHREGEIDQDAKQDQVKSPLLKAEFLKTKDMVEKEVYNELSSRFLQLEKHCFSLEISIQQKEESFQNNKPLNSKTIENADLKAQIQEKVFVNATLKNKLRNLKGTCVDTKFAKLSILGKLVLQPHRNQSVVRQPTAFKSERCKFSKPWFASQVDVINELLKPVTPYYVPKVKEFVFVKPHHVIASGSSRNISNESYGSNDMAHKYYLYVSKKKTQDKNTSLKPVSPTPFVPPSKKDYEILFQRLFDEYFNPPPRVVSLVSATVSAPRVVDPAGSLSSTIIDQDVPSDSSSLTTQEIQSQVTHQGAEEQIHRHQNA